MLTTKPKKRFPYIATLVAFGAIVIMLGLGFWQLERKAEKDLRLANIEAAKKSANISITQAFTNIELYQDYIVVGQGTPSLQYFYIDNKLIDGRAGFHVLVPYRTDLGVLMINMGWVASTGVRAKLPDIEIDLPDTIEGIVYLPVKNTLVRETNARYGEFPVLLQQADLDEISLHLGETVLPAVIRLLPDNSNFVRQWQAVTMSPEKHLGYAIQWFGLAIAALTVYLLSLLKWMHAPSPLGKND